MPSPRVSGLVDPVAIPAQKVARWFFLQIGFFRQSPMRGLAVAVHAMMREPDLDDEAVEFQFAKPMPDIIASRPKLLRGDARGYKNRISRIVVVAPFQHDIE